MKSELKYFMGMLFAILMVIILFMALVQIGDMIMQTNHVEYVE